jgi:hypothetical protein
MSGILLEKQDDGDHKQEKDESKYSHAEFPFDDPDICDYDQCS